MLWPRMADWYAPLADYLGGQAAAGQHRVVLSFGEIEAHLTRPLPRLARGSRDWWRNTGTKFQAWHGWLRAGCFVVDVNLATETVTFDLVRGGARRAAGGRALAAGAGHGASLVPDADRQERP